MNLKQLCCKHLGWLIVLTMVWLPISATAAIITVNTLDDVLVPNSNCSLREAITAANSDAVEDGCPTGSGDDVIQFSAGLTGTILLNAALPTITQNLIINGPGRDALIVHGQDSWRVFWINSATNDRTISISGVTVSHGLAGLGGGIYVDAGDTLLLSSCSITQNHSTTSGGGINSLGNVGLTDSVVDSNTSASFGAGIYNRGTLAVNNTTVSNNIATSDGGGIFNTTGGFVGIINGSTITANQSTSGLGGGVINLNGTIELIDSTLGPDNMSGQGGGIENRDQFTALNSAITGNTITGARGGGLYNASTATAILSHVTVSHNTAMPITGGGTGGGIYNSGSLILAYSTIGPGNQANDGGGGLYHTIFATPSYLSVANSTFSGNAADFGGGINYDGATWASLSNVTITDNTATDFTGGGGYGGGISMSTANLIIRNSIIAGNIDSTGVNVADCDGTFNSAGYNLIGDSNGCNGTVATDLLDVVPLLGLLADNGGPTLTHALQSISPAVDGGDPGPGGCVWDHDNDDTTPDVLLSDDQRGIPRPQDGDVDGSAHCDIGAYEYEPVPDISISDNQIAFGNVNTGESSAKVITLTNLGPVTLNVTNVQLTGANANQFSLDFTAGNNPCSGLAIVINAGQSCTMGVSFAPTSAGSKQTTVEFTSDDPDEGVKTLVLTGIGVVPATGGGGGGGCTIRPNTEFDPIIPLMLMLGGLYFRPRRKV